MYTDLIRIECPAEAYAGDIVEIYVYIKNQHSSTIGVKPKAIVNGAIEAVFTVPYSNIPAGYTYYFTGHFIMPSADAEIRAESYYYGEDGQWHFEDFQTRTVKLRAAAHWLEIEQVEAPLSAEEGELVTVGVTLINRGGYSFAAIPTAAINALALYFGNRWVVIGPMATYKWIDTFIMPDHGVRVHVEAWAEGIFPEDDTEHVDIALFEPEYKRLVINRDPSVGGSVTTSPAPATGTIYDGYYVKGTAVYVTAHPDPGYAFKSWSGELTDTTNVTATVYMSENRTITAHFVLEEDLELLEVNIDPPGAGYVTVTPSPAGGTQHNWYFPYGTLVHVTAHPDAGYVFDSWSGEMTDTTAVTAPVSPMTEKRTITAHFKVIEEALETLEVDIIPIGGGHVTTDPASYEGKTNWQHNETGQFIHGTNVQVTAHPSSGYVFEKWSDEIVGGVSLDNPAMVQVMDEHRAIKAHFLLEGEDPEVGLSILDLTLDGWGKAGETLGTSPVAVSPGDTLQVQVTVQYTATKDFLIEEGFWVSLVIDPFRDETFKYNISLPVAAVATDKPFTFDIPILVTDTLLKNKTYDLWVEFPNGLQDKAENAVTISGMPAGISGILDMVPMLIMVMMMSMMMGIMGEK